MSPGLVLYQASWGRLRTPGKRPWATQPVQSAHPVLFPVPAPPSGSGGGSGATGRPEGPTALGPCSPPGLAPACKLCRSQSFGSPRWVFRGCVCERKAYSKSTIHKQKVEIVTHFLKTSSTRMRSRKYRNISLHRSIGFPLPKKITEKPISAATRCIKFSSNKSC